MAWNDLELSDKARMMKLAVKSGITDLRTIQEVYNQYATGGPLSEKEKQKLIDRINSTSDANFVERLKDKDRAHIQFRNTDKIATHRMAYAEDDGRAIVYPEVQEVNGKLVDFGMVPYATDAAIENAIENRDTLMMSLPQAEWFTQNYKQYYPFAEGGDLEDKGVFNEDTDGEGRGFFSRLINMFRGRSKKEEAEPSYIGYFEATPEQLALAKNYLPTENGEYNMTSVGNFGDTHYGAVEERYKNLSRAMVEKGLSAEEINRLAPFLLTQQVLEGGYRLSKDNNNFGGMLNPKTRKQLEFDSEEDFQRAYLDNLDKKWGDDYLGRGQGWRNATDLADYARIVNREDLYLHSKERFDEYNRAHSDKPAYIYTPLWENNNTGLMSPAKFGGIKDRVQAMYELIKLRQKAWDDFAKLNKIVKNN